MEIFFYKENVPSLELKRIENNARIQVITFFLSEIARKNTKVL